MKKIIFILLLVILASAISGCMSKEEQKAYQEELDKILPLNEEIEDIEYPTKIETYGNNMVIRGRLDNVSKIESYKGGKYAYTYIIDFHDNKSLSLSGPKTTAFLKGGINRIVYDKNDNYINAITYRQG